MQVGRFLALTDRGREIEYGQGKITLHPLRLCRSAQAPALT